VYDTRENVAAPYTTRRNMAQPRLTAAAADGAVGVGVFRVAEPGKCQ
jgi:hypothetical protein